MTIEHVPFLLLIAILLVSTIVAPFILISGIRQIRRSTQLSRTKQALGILLLGLLIVPFAAFMIPLFWLTIVNFPFTSSVVTHTTAPTGEEACVVQISDIIEYSVSLYAHRPGNPWAWHFIDSDDDRWRSCRLEFSGGDVRVYRGSALRRIIALSQMTINEGSEERQFPADYTPEQIVAARGHLQSPRTNERK